MDQISLPEYLASIVERPGKARESQDIRLALERYRVVGVRFAGQLHLATPDVNEYVTDLEFYRDPNGRWLAKPFLLDRPTNNPHEIRLYSNPIGLFIGFDNPDGFGIIPYSDWQDHFKTGSFSKECRLKAADFLDQHKPVDYATE